MEFPWYCWLIFGFILGSFLNNKALRDKLGEAIRDIVEGKPKKKRVRR